MNDSPTRSKTELSGFHSNFPTQADIDSIFSFLTEHTLQPLIGAHFAFRDIAQACAACDGGKVNGKIVVELQGVMHTMEGAYINPLLLSGAVVIHS